MLITSISGIRGTIGERQGEDLTPESIVSFVSAYGSWILTKNKKATIIVGRDARKSGKMILDLTISTLRGMGIDIINLDLATTPTTELQVIQKKAQGGIIITASHNPKNYNGLKMLNRDGEILSVQDGEEVLKIAQEQKYSSGDDNNLGNLINSHQHTEDHIQAILDLELVDAELIKSKKYKVVVDAINSVGGIAVPLLLDKLGVEIVGLNLEASGEFAHNPEPLEKHLGELKSLVIKTNSHLGIAVDPDVDRLVFVDEKGKIFGEEYTIVAIADYVLQGTPGKIVSNLSSSRALFDLSKKYNVEYQASAVGLIHVLELMKKIKAVFGGEGNGGVIYPELHYGRDALVGIALFLTYLAKRDILASELRKEYTDYYMAKEKIVLDKDTKVDEILEKFWNKYQSEKISNIDGIKIDFADSWVHLRKSNTEPIMRIYTEAKSQKKADELAQRFISEINEYK